MDNPLYLYDLEYKNVIGVDEAGRGPLAGPVVAAAVILKEYTEELNEINDEFRNDKILKNVNVENEEYVYYVHSYFAKTDMKNIVAYSEYGTKIPGIVKNKNVYGMQFHPEKSGDTGLKLLKNWGELVK